MYIIYKYYNINNNQIDFVLDTILWLDNRTIEKSQKRIKAEYDRMKKK